MLLGYIDESYVRGERYWLAVALVPADEVPQLTLDVRQVPQILPAEYPVTATAELHGHALFHGTKGFEALEQMIDLRIRLYRRGLKALVRAATDVIFVGVDWNAPALPNDLNLHRMHAVQGMLPVIEERVERLREHCLLIADEEEATRGTSPPRCGSTSDAAWRTAGTVGSSTTFCSSTAATAQVSSAPTLLLICTIASTVIETTTHGLGPRIESSTGSWRIVKSTLLS